MIILAVESSCDECSVAILRDAEILAVRTITQSVHAPYGGVVPELAGRSHLELIDKLCAEALSEARVKLSQIDEVAATTGPGLVGSLLVGSSYARGLGSALGCPFRAIHHVEAHLWSAEIEHGLLPLPFLVLLVSGGHTMLVRVDGLRSYTVLGSTLDDALGEAYDKVGKLFGLGFPAGAAVDKLAAEGKAEASPLPAPMMDDSLNLSFSGLKTAVLYRLRSAGNEVDHRSAPDILAGFQEAALQSVTAKVRSAALTTRPHALVAAGGVAANSRLRVLLADLGKQLHVPCVFPSVRYCMDNAGMIGYLAWKLSAAGIPARAEAVRPRWPIEDLSRKSIAA